MSVVLENEKFESHPARGWLLLLLPVGAIMMLGRFDQGPEDHCSRCRTVTEDSLCLKPT